MDASLLYVSIGVAGMVLCIGYLSAQIWDRYSQRVDLRLQELEGGERSARVTRTADDFAQPARSDRKSRKRRALDSLVPNSDRDRRRHQSRLIEAGIYAPTALSTFFAAKLALMTGPPLLALLAGYWGLVDPLRATMCGMLAGGFGMVLPSFWVDHRVRLRHSILRKSLADFLDLLIVCLEAGLSVPSAIQRVTDELRIAHPPLAGELNIVQRDMALGATMEVALRRFGDRTGLPAVRSLAAYVREAQRFGTNLTHALRNHVEMLRYQQEQIAEERAQKASVKILLPMLLLILPATFIVLAGPAAIQIQQAFSK